MSTYYEIRLTTSLEEYKNLRWPAFTQDFLPRIGEHVEASNGEVLRVTRVKHWQERNEENYTSTHVVEITLNL